MTSKTNTSLRRLLPSVVLFSGCNESNQLFTTDNTELNSTQQITKFVVSNYFLRREITSCAAGFRSSFLLAENKHLFAFGRFPFTSSKCVDAREPVLFKFYEQTGETILKIAAGFHCCVILSSSQKLYYIGKCNFCNTSTTVEDHLEAEPIASVNEHAIIDVAMGAYHLLAVTKGNKLLSKSSYMKTRHHPEITDKKIVKICCGFRHSLVLTDKHLWAQGSNEDHQITGCEPNSTARRSHLEQFEVLSFFNDKNVVDLAAGDRTSVVLTADSTIYIVGRPNSSTTLQCITSLRKNSISTVVMGSTQIFAYSAVHNKLFVWRTEERPNESIQPDLNYQTPHEVYPDCVEQQSVHNMSVGALFGKEYQCTSIAAGCFHSILAFAPNNNVRLPLRLYTLQTTSGTSAFADVTIQRKN